MASNICVLDAVPKCQRSRGGWHGPRYPKPGCADECVNSAAHVTGEDIWPKGDIADALGASDERWMMISFWKKGGSADDVAHRTWILGCRRGFNEPNVDERELLAHLLSNSVGDMGYLVMDVIQPCGG